MIGNRPVRVLRPVPGQRDAEGRMTVTRYNQVATVHGNLFSQRVDAYADGQMLTVWEYKALLPAGTDIRESDRLADEDGEYEIKHVTKRRGPDGRVHHVSVVCEKASR